MKKIKEEIVISPKRVLINEDFESAFNGLKKMFVGTTAAFLVTILPKYTQDPMSILKADFKALGLAYATMQMATVLTYVYNLALKWKDKNEYIK